MADGPVPEANASENQHVPLIVRVANPHPELVASTRQLMIQFCNMVREKIAADLRFAGNVFFKPCPHRVRKVCAKAIGFCRLSKDELLLEQEKEEFISAKLPHFVDVHLDRLLDSLHKENMLPLYINFDSWTNDVITFKSQQAFQFWCLFTSPTPSLNLELEPTPEHPFPCESVVLVTEIHS